VPPANIESCVTRPCLSICANCLDPRSPTDHDDDYKDEKNQPANRIDNFADILLVVGKSGFAHPFAAPENGQREVMNDDG
jgi:hypothetical protein